MTRCAFNAELPARARLERRIDGPLSPAQHAALRLGGAAAWTQARHLARQRALDSLARQTVAAAAGARARQLGAPGNDAAAGVLARARGDLLRCRAAALEHT